MAGYRAQAMIGAMNPDISLILDTAGAWFSTDKPLQNGAHDPNETGFVLQQLELHMEAAVDPYFELQTNIVFAQFGVEVEEAYARSLSLPGRMQVRAGQFLTRFGRLNPQHPHSWHFADQPFFAGRVFGGEGLRGLGVELSWLLPLPWYAEAIVSTQTAVGACCSRSFWGGDALPVRSPVDLQQNGRLTQFFPLTRALSAYWGVSAAFGPNPTGYGNRTAVYGSDLYVRYRPPGDTRRRSLSWLTEAIARRRQIPGDVLADWGILSQLVWRYGLRWELGGRIEHGTAADSDPLDPDQHGDRQRATLAWTFYPSHFSRLRLQGSYDRPSWRSEPVVAAFLALEVLIGAHGSHDF